MKHRRPPLPESMKRHVPKGQCRWCNQPILKPDGTENRARNWHPACVDIYMIACFSDAQRKAVWKRDHGVCARCGTQTVKEVRGFTHRPLDVMKLPYHLLGPMGRLWQADHIRPLLEANGDMSYYLLSNLQTLCNGCHIQKGKEDNRRRKMSASPLRQMEFA